MDPVPHGVPRHAMVLPHQAKRLSEDVGGPALANAQFGQDHGLQGHASFLSHLRTAGALLPDVHHHTLGRIMAGKAC